MSMMGRILRIPLRAVRSAAGELRLEVSQFGSAAKMRNYDRLQLGAGPNALPGWANLDLEGNNIRWDLTRPLPLAPNSVRYIYSEHFIEHVTRAEAVRILSNCRAALRSEGVLRISTPNLERLVSDYSAGRTVPMPHGGWYPETPCRMVNEAVRNWGHQFVYDEAELRMVLHESGFHDITRVEHGESAHEELRGLETRPYFDDLIVEARPNAATG